MINNQRNDPYKGAENLITSLKADIELMEACRNRAVTEAGDHYYTGEIDATLRAIKGIEVYVLLTKKFQ